MWIYGNFIRSAVTWPLNFKNRPLPEPRQLSSRGHHRIRLGYKYLSGTPYSPNFAWIQKYLRRTSCKTSEHGIAANVNTLTLAYMRKHISQPIGAVLKWVSIQTRPRQITTDYPKCFQRYKNVDLYFCYA